jgi:type IV secretion system protein VirB9
VAVTDDGVRTLIEWTLSQPIPAVFALDEHGVETLVEGHMRDGLYVIDAVHKNLVFRLDRRTAGATRLQARARR